MYRKLPPLAAPPKSGLIGTYAKPVRDDVFPGWILYTLSSVTFRRSVFTFLALLILTIFWTILPAGPASSRTRNTLFGWDEWVRMMIHDPSHSYGGVFYDRGLYRYVTPLMPKEHDLDLHTYEFTTVDLYDWYYSGEDGFRAYTGSMNLGKFLTGYDLRNRLVLSDRMDMNIHVHRRSDMRSDRGLLWLGFDYNLRNGRTLGIRQTLTEEKSDLDVALFYRHGKPERGFIQLEASMLDYSNNAIYALSKSRNRDFDESRKYHRRPVLFSFRASTPEWFGWRGEAMAGILTRSETQVGAQSRVDINTLDRQKTHYAGTLLEWSADWITAALTWQYKYAWFARENLTDNYTEPIDYGNIQVQSRFGVFLGLQTGRIQFQNWVFRANVRDNQKDKHREVFWQWCQYNYQIYPFVFRENRIMMKNRILYMPEIRGFLGGIEWNADYRDFRSDTFISEEFGIISGFAYQESYPWSLVETNERVTLLFGYRFSPRASLFMGLSYDVDGDMYIGRLNMKSDSRSLFDGGFGRLMMTW